MQQRVFFISVLAISLSMIGATNVQAKPHQKPAATSKASSQKTSTKHAALPRTAQSKAIKQFRTVRNALMAQRKVAAQKHANAARSLQRAKETERASKDVHTAAMISALKRVPAKRPDGVSAADYAMKDRGVRDAVKKLQTAAARRGNAAANLTQTRANFKEANRQVSAANRTLSLAKKTDWVNAYRIAGRAKPAIPPTRARKISYIFTPQGPTPKGTGGPRKGILKMSAGK